MADRNGCAVFQAIGKYNRARWVMTLLIGASVAVVAFGITQAQEQLLDFKFKLVSHGVYCTVLYCTAAECM
jgi:type III secretory pathway component EscS